MSRPFHILIADDDVDDQLIIKSALTSIGSQAQITSVYNGLELISTLFGNSNSPDLIILDIHMPLMDGLEALVKIKTHDVHKNIPVYVLTTMRSPQKFEDVKGTGANGYFSKPSTFTAYQNLIRDIISDLA